MIDEEKSKQVEYKVKLYFNVMIVDEHIKIVVLGVGIPICISICICICCIIKIVHTNNEIQTLKEKNEEIVLHYENILQDVNIENENLKDSVRYYRDAYNDCVLLYDSICEEIVVRDIKLERIAEYNRIAGQNNNIKYLRGWINRVLNN